MFPTSRQLSAQVDWQETENMSIAIESIDAWASKGVLLSPPQSQWDP